MSGISYDGIWFIYVIVPATISLVSSLTVIVSIIYYQLHDRVYHRLSFMISFSYVLMFGSWMLGNKYEAPLTICRIQEYMFQLGTLFNMAAISSISLYIFYMIQTKSLPRSGQLRPYVLSLFAMCFVSIMICICTNTASLFCDTHHGGSSRLVYGEDGVSLQTRMGYIFAYVIPAAVMTLFNLVGFGASIMYYVRQHARDILPLLQRLTANNMIIMMLYIPGTLMFFTTDDITMVNIGSMLFSSSGGFFALAYFYYTVHVDKVMLLPCSGRSEMKESLTDSTIYPSEESSISGSSMFEVRTTSAFSIESNFE